MLDSILGKKYQKLEKQVERYNQTTKYARWIRRSGYIVYFGALLGIVVLMSLIPSLLEKSWEVTIIVGLAIIYSFLTVFLSGRLYDRANLRRPDADDWMLYHTCSILECLEEHQKEKRPKLKDELMKKAVEDAKEILSTVKEDWKLGDFRLAKRNYGTAISNITVNFRKSVIPSLKKKQKLDKVEQALYQFANYLIFPKIETLEHANSYISKELDSYETKEARIFRRRGILKHALIVGLIFSFSVVPILLGFHFGPISLDTAMLVFAGIFGPSIAVYISNALKKK